MRNLIIQELVFKNFFRKYLFPMLWIFCTADSKFDPYSLIPMLLNFSGTFAITSGAIGTSRELALKSFTTPTMVPFWS